MTTVNERNFSDFELGDNVYELAGGLIPRLADRLAVPIGDEPTSSDLQLIMNQVGPNKELRTNQKLELDREEAADFVVKAGTQQALRRSLWTPDNELLPGSVDTLVAMGAVANWQDRTAKLISDLPFRVPVRYLAGNRLMATATEVTNPNVSAIGEDFDIAPTEAEYAASVISPLLRAAGVRVLVTPHTTGNADTMFYEMFKRTPGLLYERIGVARVANAGIVMALQMRDAARKVQQELVEAGQLEAAGPLFDADRRNPQVFVATDKFTEVARTEEQDADPEHYQKAATGLRQVVLTAKKLHEAGDEQS